MENTRRKPEWLKIKLPMGQLSVDVLNTIRGHHLNTICTSGRCPNQGECWGCGTATFMIGGNICTRACKFCNVTTGHPAPLDPQEPEHVARSIRFEARSDHFGRSGRCGGFGCFALGKGDPGYPERKSGYDDGGIDS